MDKHPGGLSDEQTDKYGPYSKVAEKLRIAQEQYEPYEKMNTIEGYKEFINKYPDNYLVYEAEMQIRNIEFSSYEKTNTIEGYMEFIKNNPDNPNVERAYRNIEKLEFKICEREDTITCFNNFLGEYPESIFVNDAMKRLQELEFRQFSEQLMEKYRFDLLLYRLSLKRLKRELHAEGKDSLADFKCFASFTTNEGKKYFQTHLIYPDDHLPSKTSSGEMSDEIFNDIFSRQLEYLNSKFKQKKKIDGFSFGIASSRLGLYQKRKAWAEYYFPLDKVNLFARGELEKNTLFEKSIITYHQRPAQKDTVSVQADPASELHMAKHRKQPMAIQTSLSPALRLTKQAAESAAEEMPDPQTYLPGFKEILTLKANYDDRTDLLENYHPENILPPDVWKWLHFDVAEMKKQTAEILGFTAPEQVGIIAPEIEPGTYSYKDLEQHPGLKNLFPPAIQQSFRKGGTPFVCSIMDFEIQPTRQLHWALPVCELTRKNMGKTRLDKDGYIIARSWQGGCPFPRPSGKFKAQQVYYNMEKRGAWDSARLTCETLSFNKKLKQETCTRLNVNTIRLMGRSIFPPFGWFDRRAEKRGESGCTTTELFEPSKLRGIILMSLRYDDPNKMHTAMVYVPMLKRVRKIDSTDTEGRLFFGQKISPRRYPYEFEIIEEREFLLPISYDKADVWVDKGNGYTIRNLAFQRRACYVLQMTQLDTDYVYSKRIYYVDKETFAPVCGEFYDQKGRLYRVFNRSSVYLPECGAGTVFGTPAWDIDHVDMKSNYQMPVLMPANFGRETFNLEAMAR